MLPGNVLCRLKWMLLLGKAARVGTIRLIGRSHVLNTMKLYEVPTERGERERFYLQLGYLLKTSGS